ncbi:MAG: hypothetical protein U0871_09655 [Gemmataceae bacterium]
MIPTSAVAAASASDTPAGSGYAHSSPTQQNSASVPCRPSNPWFDPHTRSPGLNRLTPAPTASTVPAKSHPGMYGFGRSAFTIPLR